MGKQQLTEQMENNKNMRDTVHSIDTMPYKPHFGPEETAENVADDRKKTCLAKTRLNGSLDWAGEVEVCDEVGCEDGRREHGARRLPLKQGRDEGGGRPSQEAPLGMPGLLERSDGVEERAQQKENEAENAYRVIP